MIPYDNTTYDNTTVIIWLHSNFMRTLDLGAGNSDIFLITYVTLHEFWETQWPVRSHNTI